MSEIVKTPTETVQTPDQTDAGHPHPDKKEEEHRHHHHHQHDHAIAPTPTGTPHLNPGSIKIG